MEFETVIGLEIHAQLKTETKIFCGCRNQFGAQPNSHGCPVCLGLPGALPVLNRRVVEMAIMMGGAVGCTVAPKSIFARKNYFYPDLPKGYQISQYDMPLCEHGRLTIDAGEGSKKIRITRIHLEEDAGKLVHDQDIDSLFDVNRCGTPLIEIVTEPDIRTPAEAYAFLTDLKKILEYLEICDCNMEEGSLRCDANISLRPKGQEELGTKTELKNMNTFRGVEKALQYEQSRQAEILSDGGSIRQQTFLWDPQKNQTSPMRTKEEAHDYRYFPDPDLVPLTIDDAWVREIHQSLPELPATRQLRFSEKYGLSPEHAAVLTDSRPVADYFEATVAAGAEARSAANWVMGDILRICKDRKCTLSDLNVTPQRLARLIELIDKNTISTSAAKSILPEIHGRNEDPEKLVEEKGLTQISDVSELEKEIDHVLENSPSEVERFKAGEKKLQGFFVGQVMKATRGKANPKEVNRILAEKLK